jgi:hypothetical protein
MKLPLVTFLVLLLLLAACGSEDAEDNSAGTPGGTGDEPTNVVMDVEGLRERAAELDGETVTVRAYYWSNADAQYLSDILMESYPPQIPYDLAVILNGEMPEPVLEMLNHADSAFAPIVWGEVEVTGTVRVDGDDVHLEIIEVFAVQS